ncbi:enterotoxin A family protein [Luteimonas panaciterrae]|uniref:enterotoxin A family protein n=1 Tax=Luteimonas panaciterrae TaxID=363885 RepID=UPI001CFC1B24
MKRIIEFIVVCFILFFIPKTVLAVDYLYRVDTRPPEEVFNSNGGFSPLGTNRSLVAHVRGNTCMQGNATTGYVSVSSDPVWASNYARRLYSQLNGRTVYVYIIRQTNNFYNAARVLSNILVPDHPYMQSAQSQSEWVTSVPVTPDSIYGVREFSERAVDPNYTPPIRRNSVYRDEPSSVNNGTFTPEEYPPHYGRQPHVVSRTPLVGACLSATLSCISRPGTKKRDTTSSQPYCASIESILGNVTPAIGLLRE